MFDSLVIFIKPGMNISLLSTGTSCSGGKGCVLKVSGMELLIEEAVNFFKLKLVLLLLL